MPSLLCYENIVVLIGRHSKWNSKLTEKLDNFCKLYNSVVLYDYNSYYKGNKGVNNSIFKDIGCHNLKVDLLISVGSVTEFPLNSITEMWRVDPKGEIVDPEGTVTKIFGMDEQIFFGYYSNIEITKTAPLVADTARDKYNKIISELENISFSNIWVAKNTINSLPLYSIYHHVESKITKPWRWFNIPKTVDSYFHDEVLGIDGQAAALYGEAIAVPNKLHFAVITPEILKNLLFITFGKIPQNLRLLVINYDEESVKTSVENIKINYFTAKSKDEFVEGIIKFTKGKNEAIIFELFLDAENDKNVIMMIINGTSNQKQIRCKDFL